MNRKSFAWIMLGGFALAFGSVELAACSSDGGGTGFPNQPDATSKDDGGGSKDDGGTTGDGGKKDGSTAGDAAKECGTPPQLRPRANMDAGGGADGGPFMNFFCPFSSPPGTPVDYCNSGTEHCCIPFGGSNNSTCETGGCPDEADGGPFDGRDIECTDPIDCTTGSPAGPVCCGIGEILKDPECGNYFGKGFRGTKCKTSCDPNENEFVICQKQEHCSSGTCTPASAAGLQFGKCM